LDTAGQHFVQCDPLREIAAAQFQNATFVTTSREKAETSRAQSKVAAGDETERRRVAAEECGDLSPLCFAARLVAAGRFSTCIHRLESLCHFLGNPGVARPNAAGVPREAGKSACVNID
jgi:hypothetical protein